LKEFNIILNDKEIRRVSSVLFYVRNEQRNFHQRCGVFPCWRSKRFVRAICVNIAFLLGTSNFGNLIDFNG
jgi:hypothetical protein